MKKRVNAFTPWWLESGVKVSLFFMWEHQLMGRLRGSRVGKTGLLLRNVNVIVTGETL